MYGHVLCRFCVLGDFHWIAGAVDSISCGSWGFPYSEYHSRLAKDEVGTSWSVPRLYMKRTL